MPYQVVHPRSAELPAPAPGDVYCIDSRLAAEVPQLPGPTVVVLSGARVSDELTWKLQSGQVKALRLADVTPDALLAAALSAVVGGNIGTLSADLRHFGRLSRVDDRLVRAFLGNPGRMRRLSDLRRALAPLSREAAQERVRACGFGRAEHLFATLRCAAWVLLLGLGLERTPVERYLEVCDRPSFRRACRRAGVPAPRRGLRPEAFGP